LIPDNVLIMGDGKALRRLFDIRLTFRLARADMNQSQWRAESLGEPRRLREDGVRMGHQCHGYADRFYPRWFHFSDLVAKLPSTRFVLSRLIEASSNKLPRIKNRIRIQGPLESTVKGAVLF
jgi:hypothetical protein